MLERLRYGKDETQKPKFSKKIALFMSNCVVYVKMENASAKALGDCLSPTRRV